MESTSAIKPQGKIGDITIIKTIGHGATCKVKLGKLPDGKNVAVKMMNHDLAKDEKKLLLSEVEAMSKIQHPNIVNVIRYGTETYEKTSGKSKEALIIVLELAQGGESFDFIAH